jgi:hypothetical protein
MPLPIAAQGPAARPKVHVGCWPGACAEWLFKGYRCNILRNFKDILSSTSAIALSASNRLIRSHLELLSVFNSIMGALSIDFPCCRSNNPPMARPDAVRRVKTYSAANGYVYQYCFYEVNRLVHDGSPAGEFIYAISADRKTSFGLRIIVLRAALEAWAQANGRALTSSEEYAVAKMRLFQAFDEGAVPLTAEAAAAVTLLVDDSNLEELLGLLNI